MALALLRAFALVVTLIAGFARGLGEPFDAQEASIDTIHSALFAGSTTCREIVSSFLARIEAYNPIINALVSLNPAALEAADLLDEQLATGNVTGSLFCVPILLKDNYDAVGMPTTGSCHALADLYPTVDAPTVTALKKAGAIILGKANMHELALEGLTVSSQGGQTLNPYDLTRTPGGSSGGTGAAVAASLAVFGTGTDTVNSLRNPASANNLFSFRPTRGLISRAGVIPVSYTQDALGAIGRSVSDIAVAMTVMASVGYDPADNATRVVPPEVVGKDYSVAILGGTLKGKRLGLIAGFMNQTASDETSPVNDAMGNMVSLLEAASVSIINITSSRYDAEKILAMDTQRMEYREELDGYLTNPTLQGEFPRSFSELYSSGDFLVIPKQYDYIKTAFVSSTGNASYIDLQQSIRDLTLFVQRTFHEHQLDGIIYPQQKNLVVKHGSPSQSGRNGILAALTGLPVVAVPIGFSPSTVEAPIGVPIGMEILGSPWSEDLLLNMARHIDDISSFRRTPTLTSGRVEVSRLYTSVPVITPNTKFSDSAYPVGTLER